MFDNLLMLTLAAAVGTALIAAGWFHLQDARARARLRASYLDACKPVFSGGQKAIMPTGFPRMAGAYKGHEFDLQVVPDALNMRKLPTLWLLVTLTEPQPVRATFDLMMRPRGVELFSKFATLPVQLSPDPAFPHDCAMRTDDATGLPPREVLLRHIGFFRDERAKELVISPKGLRVVWLAEEAHRGKYLLFRDSEMGRAPLDSAALVPLLDYLLVLGQDLASHKETQ